MRPKQIIAEVIQHHPLSLQVCVPKEWDDDEIEDFANAAVLCGTENGWTIHKEGPNLVRVPCEADPENKVHVLLLP